jgi:hypothetical protein
MAVQVVTVQTPAQRVTETLLVTAVTVAKAAKVAEVATLLFFIRYLQKVFRGMISLSASALVTRVVQVEMVVTQGPVVLDRLVAM